jgi:hypothetical protein
MVRCRKREQRKDDGELPVHRILHFFVRRTQRPAYSSGLFQYRSHCGEYCRCVPAISIRVGACAKADGGSRWRDQMGLTSPVIDVAIMTQKCQPIRASQQLISGANIFALIRNHCHCRHGILIYDLAGCRSAFDHYGDCMVDYRCYILDAEDHILQAHELACEDDAQAESAAVNFLAQDPYNRSVEVWKATRRLMILEREAASGLRIARRLRRSGRALHPAA